MRTPYLSLNIIFIILLSAVIFPRKGVSQANEPEESRRVRDAIYYNIDQGFSWGLLTDDRMSNLHYQGPGAILNFARRAHRPRYIAEWSFARLRYNYSTPSHKGTVVENPAAGIRYMHLRKIYTPESYNIYIGGQVNVFGNFRLAGRLGNSYLYADLVGEIRPQAGFHTHSRFLWRDWNIELSAAASLLGYTVRIPEYGVSFELGEDGGVKTQGFEQQVLLPYNYVNVTTGVFIREKFGGESNPNWFRVGYLWDYYTMKGKHNLNTNNALHQLVLELYFMVRQ
ncbi:MAG: hypothetical protein EA408_03635 [Marinilabiliales bacterium]|nr:MAG: hypothetical protein EA408_03635 [Marinilabiliales bacterium]